MSLSKFAVELERTTVALRRSTVELRALSDLESERLVAHFPPPVPRRTRPDPAGGSLAPEIPDDTDPEYVREVQAWKRSLMRMEVAVACGECGTEDRAAIEAAALDLANRLTERELYRLFEAVRTIGWGGGEQESRARDVLIADMRELKAEDIAEVERLPERYGTTIAYLDLRVRERFGLPPWSVYPSAGWAALCRANERIRIEEERAILGAAAGAGS